MSSSPQEPKSFFKGFRFFDWFTIFVVSDLASSGIFGILAGASGAIWMIVLAWCLWWFHIYNVKRDIERGLR